jgi:predicted acylesterase/phospholipase RssA
MPVDGVLAWDLPVKTADELEDTDFVMVGDLDDFTQTPDGTLGRLAGTELVQYLTRRCLRRQHGYLSIGRVRRWNGRHDLGLSGRWG